MPEGIENRGDACLLRQQSVIAGGRGQRVARFFVTNAILG
jgi:hypothetical protein